jgi:hypothetical protein
MSAILKCFRTHHVFYAELVSDDHLIDMKQITLQSMQVDFDSYYNGVYIGFDDFEDFEFSGASDLPGYIVVTFFKVVNGKKIWLRSYLYGPEGFIGYFDTPSAALQAARAHRDGYDSTCSM